MLECRAVQYRYPDSDRNLLSELDFSLSAGELCVLLGLNGSGKSTLCRLLGGLYLPNSGQVRVDGLSTALHGETAEVRRLVQLVTHDPESQVIGETAAEDVAFGLVNFGFDDEEVQRQTHWALATFGIGELGERPISSLSGGQLQLLRLAGALAVKPRYLVLDEAVAMLDPATRREALQALRKLATEGESGVLLATHDLDDLAWADRVCVLEQGRLALDAPRGEALEWLASERERAFELPALLDAAQHMRYSGRPLPLALSAEEFVEAVCASNS